MQDNIVNPRGIDEIQWGIWGGGMGEGIFLNLGPPAICAEAEISAELWELTRDGCRK